MTVKKKKKSGQGGEGGSSEGACRFLLACSTKNALKTGTEKQGQKNRKTKIVVNA